MARRKTDRIPKWIQVPPTNMSFTVGVAVDYDMLNASGSPNPQYIASGLPTGLHMDLMTGRISGIPTITGSYPVLVRAYNGAGSVSTTFTMNINPVVVPPPPPPPSSGTFPSRLHVVSHRLLNEAEHDVGVLKGFNVQYGSTFWSQANYNDMAALGAKIVRHIVFWDQLEPTAGNFSSAELANLDSAIAKAGAAGMYTVLSAPHLNVGRVPTWARTTGNEWHDYVAHGRAMTELLATRYKDNKYVIGMLPNEPTIPNLAQLMADYVITCGWHTAIATEWPLWVNPTAFGNGTPSPASTNASIDPAALAALDINGHGVIIEWHDYLNLAGSGAPDSYQHAGAYAGTINPIQQVGTTGGQFHGWGGNYNYPDTAQARADFSAHIAPLVTLRNQNGKFALAVGELGMDNQQSGEAAFGADKAACYAAAGVIAEMWWDYDVNLSGEPFSARPGGTWRASVTNWMKPPATELFFDDFIGVAGSPPNPAKWWVNPWCENDSSKQLMCYNPSNVFLDGDSHLVLRVSHGTKGRLYDAGQVNTFIRGAWPPQTALAAITPPCRLEASIKMPIGAGLWCGFWAESVDPNFIEVDIAECRRAFPSVDTYHIHDPNGRFPEWNSSRDLGFDLADTFHTYWANYYSDHVTFGVDSVTLETCNFTGTPAPRLGLILSNDVGDPNQWGGQGGPPPDARIPADMLIDYVRATRL